MKQRLNRASRLYDTYHAVIEEGRAHGRNGWVTQSIVAHAMNLRPGCYVLGLLNELFRKGRLVRITTPLVNGSKRYEFQDADYEGPGKVVNF
ncbi:MAG: hypothetical protein V3V74_06755 [Nitrosomonadaceae bacterium]